MYSVIVKEQNWVGKAGMSFLLTAVMVTTFFGYDLLRGNAVPLITAALFTLPPAVLGIILTLDYRNRFLGLDTKGCCYQTMFRKQTHFALQEIGRIETKSEFIILLDASGTPLARIETNMENADQVIPYIQRQRSEAVFGKEVTVRVVRRPGDQADESEKRMMEAVKRREDKWKDIEKDWEKEPRFYQTPQWIDILKFGSRAISLTCFGAALFAFGGKLSPHTGAVLCSVIPLVIWIAWIVFQRVVIWRKNEKLLLKDAGEYVMVPFWGQFCMLYAVVFFLFDGMLLMDRSRMQTMVWCVFALLFMVQLWCTRTDKGWREIAEPAFFLLMYCYAGIHCWPVALQTGEALHTPVPVLEKQVDDTGRSTSHYLKVQMKTGNEWFMEVMPEVFEKAEIGDTVEICLHKSLLEDYMDIHLKGAECEW